MISANGIRITDLMNKEGNVLDRNKFAEFANEHGIKFFEHEELSKHTSFKIGGPAEIFAKPENNEQVSAITKYCKENDIPLLPLGKGSNVLVSDNGIDGVVMYFGNDFGKIEIIDENTIYCEAGAGLAALCNFALDNELSGLEFAYGIPGSVGGAVFMNAGAYGGQLSDVLRRVTAVTPTGDVVTMEAEELALGYRHSVFMENGCIVLEAELELKTGDPCAIRAAMTDYLTRRRDKQPLEYPSAGSFFKRPEGHFAGALIEQCGLKGFTVGGAAVSEKHAGFVINLGGATCADVLALGEAVSKTVKERFGVELEREVQLIGG